MKILLDIDLDYPNEWSKIAADIEEAIAKLYPSRDVQVQRVEMF